MGDDAKFFIFAIPAFLLVVFTDPIVDWVATLFGG